MKKTRYVAAATYIRMFEVEVGECEDPYTAAEHKLRKNNDITRLVNDGTLQFCNWHVHEVKEK